MEGTLLLVGMTCSLLQREPVLFHLDTLIACPHFQEVHVASTERCRGGGSEIGQYSLQVLYGCNSLTRDLVSSEWNSFNVHFALDIFLTLTQAEGNAYCEFHCEPISDSFPLSVKQDV